MWVKKKTIGVTVHLLGRHVKKKEKGRIKRTSILFGKGTFVCTIYNYKERGSKGRHLMAGKFDMQIIHIEISLNASSSGESGISMYKSWRAALGIGLFDNNF